MSPHEQQPKFFADRSLGRIGVPSRLRAADWELVTLAEHYGTPADEQIADVQWIQDAASRGWPILMKDKRIRHRRAEIDVVVQRRAQCFVITRGDQLRARGASGWSLPAGLGEIRMLVPQHWCRRRVLAVYGPALDLPPEAVP